MPTVARYSASPGCKARGAASYAAAFGAQARSATVTVHGQELHLRSAGDGIRAGMALVPENRIEHGVLARMTMAEGLSLPTVGRYWKGGAPAARR